MRKRWTAVLSLIALCVMVVLAGCTKSPATPEELFNKALKASTELKSYEFSSEATLKLEFPDSLMQADPATGMIAGFLGDITLSASGAYQEEPLKTEATMDLKLGGDVGMTIRVPVIMEQDKMWVKVPNIPMLAGIFPQDVVGKYIELDFEQLAEMDPQAGAFNPDAFNVETQKQLGMDIMGVLLKHFDEEEYVEIVNVEEAGLPAGVDASDVLRISLTQDQFQQVAATLVEDALPELIDVLAKPEYAALLGETIDAEQAKKDLAESQDEIKAGLEELKEMLIINELSMLMALDKDGNTPYSNLRFDFAIQQDGEQMAFKGSMSSTMTNFNGTPAFELEEPTADNTLTIDQLDELINAEMAF
ncbi:hypothetical protein DUZ99_16270 [Xylanibacillus composti]|uniref:Lipoprotein n=1 Tax=Xylanibacillus composti TaxID=1572762 RepID=A0A8J4H3N7_9BACL|nr:hypothetical protein [Xylanibacillus composti]MDT9726538.1 hypothetical protein [Xylanibacillus composti]GIQ68956.1 hypothetical protein XYCOK13_17800 [Xylanibacillus composti]